MSGAQILGGAIFGGFGGSGGGGSNYTAPMQAGIRFQTSAYGLAIPLIYGRTRVPGNLIWYGDFRAIPHTTTTSSGGSGGKGGGGGGGGSSNTNYTYTASIALALSEGEIVQIGAVWRDKDYYPSNTIFSVFNGSLSQEPWGYLSTSFPDQALAYRGIAYAAVAAYDLGDGASLPNHSFEVYGIFSDAHTDLVDCIPSEILIDFLTNDRYGAGFPAEKISDLSSYRDYCLAQGLLLSAAIDSQSPAQEFVTQLMRLTNSAIYYSEGILKIVPYSDSTVTGNGVTWVPNNTPIYDITDDDFISDSNNDPVKVSRGATADAYNHVQVEFINRSNQYNVEISEAKDLVNIDAYGLRTQDPLKAHEIADAAVARSIAQLILQRVLYVRNTYEFTVGLKFCLLEPTDLITLTDTYLGLNQRVVRILSIEEQSDNTFLITTEDAPEGVYSNTLYPSQIGVGYQNDFNVSPGDTTTPIIFEPPDLLTANGLEVWIAACGGIYWGGCQVWASYDGATYQQLGIITQPGRLGALTSTLSSHADPDTNSILSVDLSRSRGNLSSGTQLDADNLSTLSYVGEEFVSYETATLTAANQYDLSYLRRGAYGSDITDHQAGTPFVRLDASIFKDPFTTDKIGKLLYLKFPAYNIYGAALQQLADVQPVTYLIQGSALNSPLPNVQNIITNFNNASGGNTIIHWDAITDFRQPDVDYEVRVGDNWATARIIGRTPLTQINAMGDGMYWIAAHYLAKGGLNVYSEEPQSVLIAGASLVTNVVASWSEADTGWSGTLTDLVLDHNALIFDTDTSILHIGDVLTITDIFNTSPSNGSVLHTNGEYALPFSHVINVGRVAPCNIVINYDVRAERVGENVLFFTNMFDVTDLLDASLAPFITFTPQIATAGTDAVFGDWQNFIPGYYNAQYFKSRFLVSTADLSVNVRVSDYIFSVDVPDRLDSGTLAVNSHGSSVTYDYVFNGGNAGQPVPLVQITVVDALQGDTAVLSNQSVTGFDVQILNGGTGVNRTINWLAQGY